MQKILILGVNGFIGSTLVKSILKNTNWEIYGIDLQNHKIQDSLKNPRFHFTKGDAVQDTIWIEDHVKLCDVIIPLVAIANPALYVSNPLFVFQLDFESNLAVIKLCVKHDKYVLFPSTSEVYGMSNDIPFCEKNSDLVTGPISKQRWIYSCSKQMLDRVIAAYGQQEGLKYTLFRPFNWIGSAQDEISKKETGGARLLVQFASNIMNGKNLYLVDGGEQQRCFLHIDDGISALIKIIETKDITSQNEIFNIGNPENEFSIKQIAHMVVDKMKTYPKYKQLAENTKIIAMKSDDFYGKGYQDVQRRVPSIDNITTKLNWKPTVSMDEALTEIFDFHLKD